MNVAGIGIVSACGRGVGALEQALDRGWVPPATVEVRGVEPLRLPVLAVAPETLTDKTVLVKARRADRFTRMAVLAACDAVEDSGLGTGLDRGRLGVIVGTALGPHVTTFSFLDGILDFGDAAVSPTAFSHSVHNAAASYIAMTLDVRGPTLTLTRFHFAFHQALLVAQGWLATRRCDAVLVGVVDELGAVMQHVCARLLRPAADGRIKPLAFAAQPESVPGEGGVFFLLTRDDAGQAYGRIAAGASWPEGGIDLQLLDACGLTGDEGGYRDLLVPGVPAAGYAPLFGSLFTISGFHAAVAALMLKRQRVYAAPSEAAVTVAPGGPATLSRIGCAGLDGEGHRAILRLSNRREG